MDDGQKPAGTI